MKPLLRDAHGALLRGLRDALAGDEGDRDLPRLTIEGLQSRAWASATFSGNTHVVELRWRGGDVEPLLARLAELEVDMPGHAMIDLAVAEVARDGDATRVVIEALTLED